MWIIPLPLSLSLSLSLSKMTGLCKIHTGMADMVFPCNKLETYHKSPLFKSFKNEKKIFSEISIDRNSETFMDCLVLAHTLYHKLVKMRFWIQYSIHVSSNHTFTLCCTSNISWLFQEKCIIWCFVISFSAKVCSNMLDLYPNMCVFRKVMCMLDLEHIPLNTTTPCFDKGGGICIYCFCM